MQKKKCLPIMVAVLIIPVLILGRAEGQSKRKFAVRVTGGGIRWMMNEWNDTYGYYLRKRQLWTKVQGEHFYWGDDGEIELQYILHPQYRIGLGVHHAWGSTEYHYEDSYNYPKEPKEIRNETLDTKITPFCITLYNTSTTYPNRPYVGIGIGYYLSSYTHHSDYAEGDSSMVRDATMSASGIGYHAVFGTEYFLSQSLALVGEVKVRYAKITGYTGKVTQTVNNGSPVESDAELIFAKTNQITTFQTLPKGTPLPVYWKAREGIMNYSGVSLKLGLSYHF